MTEEESGMTGRSGKWEVGEGSKGTEGPEGQSSPSETEVTGDGSEKETVKGGESLCFCKS